MKTIICYHLRGALILVLFTLRPSVFGQGGELVMTNHWMEGPTYSTACSPEGIAIFGNGAMLELVDISAPDYPERISSIPMAGVVQDIAIQGHYAIIALDEIGLSIVDFSDPGSLEVIATRGIPGYCGKLLVRDDIVFYTSSFKALHLLDISNIREPREISQLDLQASPGDLDVSGDYLYVAAGNDGMKVVDISNLESPSLAATLDANGVNSVLVMDAFAYLAADDGLYVVDISQPTMPNSLLTLPVQFDNADLAYRENMLYLMDTQGNILVIDITERANPVAEGTYSTDGVFREISVEGDHALIAHESEGMLILNISDPTDMTKANGVDAGSFAVNLEVRNGMAYIANGYDGLMIMDMSIPHQAVKAGTFSTEGHTNAVWVENAIAYIAGDYRDMVILDISDPAAITQLGAIDLGSTSTDIYQEGNYAFVAQTTGLKVVNIADPTQPVEVAALSTWSQIYSLEKHDDLIYLGTSTGLQMINVSDPLNPVEVGRLNLAQRVYDVKVREHYAFLTNAYNGLLIVDIENPGSLKVLSQEYLSGYSRTIEIAGDVAFIGADWAGIYVVDITDVKSPETIGHFDTGGDVWRIVYADGYVYAADYDCGIAVFDYMGSLAVPLGAHDDFQLNVYPVPSAGQVTIQFSVRRSGDIKALIYDGSGRPVHTIVNAVLQPGQYQYAWPGSLMHTSQRLPAGWYTLVIMDSEGKHASRQLLISGY